MRFEYESRDESGQWWRSHPAPNLQRGYTSSLARAKSQRSSWRWSSGYAPVPYSLHSVQVWGFSENRRE